MTRTALPALLLTLAALLLPAAAQAWGDQGHEVIGTLAYPRLTPQARQAVDALLAHDGDTLSARDFVSRTTWADKYRDSDRYTPTGQPGHQLRYRATRQWHFVDIQRDGGTLDEACFGRPPLAAGAPASAGPAQACVVDKLHQFTRELADPATPVAEKRLALKFVMHFVGDLHQPLHACDHHDGGGNGVVVEVLPSKARSNLHAYWDSTLVRRLGATVAAAAARVGKTITPARATAWAQGGFDDWAMESYTRARTVAYDFKDAKTFVDDHGGVGEILDAGYEARALPVAREALAKAAVRLAAVLNDAFR